MRRFAVLMPLLIALLAPAPALARNDDERGRGSQTEDTRGRGNDDSRGRGNRYEERSERASDFVPLERVLRQIERRYPGHQLSVSGPMPGGGGYVYRIKWLTDGGAVLYIIADAESGAILSVDGG